MYSLLLALLIGLMALGRGEADESLFNSESIIDLKIEVDLVALVNDIAYNRDYHRAVISYPNQYGFDEMIPLKIKTRGNFRRGRDNCNFPPFLLNFPQKWTVGTLFEGRNKVKLVTHCMTDEDIYQQYVLKEYLVYKLLNQLTEYSYQVRLARITYIDSEDSVDNIQRYGFFIEDSKSLGGRIGGDQAKVVLTSHENPDYYLSTLVSVFQFMVGNTDWYLPDHNMETFALKDGKDTVAIPYDFDLTGFVNPHYTSQFMNYKLSSARERYYLGFCRAGDELDEVGQLFQSRKQDMMDEISGFDVLPQSIRQDCLDYLAEFFELLQQGNLPPAVETTCKSDF